MENIKLISQLEDSKTAIRRRAAKKIRKEKPNNFCQPLLEALQKELNKKSWETQYHLIMAIGELSCQECLDELQKLSSVEGLEYMVYLAFGDAITRIDEKNRISFLSKSIVENNTPFVEGIVRGYSFSNFILPESSIQNLIEFSNEPENDHIKFWIAAAAANWKSDLLHNQLFEWSKSNNQDLAKAANASLIGKSLKWKIL